MLPHRGDKPLAGTKLINLPDITFAEYMALREILGQDTLKQSAILETYTDTVSDCLTHWGPQMGFHFYDLINNGLSQQYQ